MGIGLAPDRKINEDLQGIKEIKVIENNSEQFGQTFNVEVVLTDAGGKEQITKTVTGLSVSA